MAKGKAAGKAKEVKGKVKKAAGKAVGNRRLEAKGRAGQSAGDLKQAGAKAKDAVKKLPAGGSAGRWPHHSSDGVTAVLHFGAHRDSHPPWESRCHVYDLHH